MHDISAIDPWFLEHIRLIIVEEKRLAALPAPLGSADFRRAKKFGFSDRQLAHLTKSTEPEVRTARKAAGVVPAYRLVDTCAAEFEAFTPYHYSSYEEETEVRPRTTPAVIILGSGPNRIGQGIEFDYSCVHASFTLRDAEYETIMIN